MSISLALICLLISATIFSKLFKYCMKVVKTNHPVMKKGFKDNYDKDLAKDALLGIGSSENTADRYYQTLFIVMLFPSILTVALAGFLYFVIIWLFS